jgi:hypothetical protein
MINKEIPFLYQLLKHKLELNAHQGANSNSKTDSDLESKQEYAPPAE